MKSVNTLLASLAELMDQREIDAIEVSILKTLRELLAADWAAIYHAGADGVQEFAVGLHGDALVEHDSDGVFAGLAAGADVVSVAIVSQSHDTPGQLQLARTPALSEEETQLLAGLLRVYDNYVAVLRQSQTDRLTGLLNRHTFDVQLDRALQVIREHYQSGVAGDKRRRLVGESGGFWIGNIDIDHFKRINDQFGHLYGDEVLLNVARLLQSTFRKSDLVYRFGGEEFVAIVFVENARDASTIFERLRQTIESHQFPLVERVTVSVGVASIRNNSAPVELLGFADQALYYAKNAGRNQVCFYDDLVAQEKISVPASGSDITFF